MCLGQQQAEERCVKQVCVKGGSSSEEERYVMVRREMERDGVYRRSSRKKGELREEVQEGNEEYGRGKLPIKGLFNTKCPTNEGMQQW